ncbi:hypothetical protein JL722_363 [Aureococcus anophagefferens]|nr:hypothetical protein JL722_363 [Aureococcus anophagefferens]
MKISMTDGDLVGNSRNFVAYAKEIGDSVECLSALNMIQDTNFDEHWNELASRTGMNSLLGTIITFWRIDGGPEGHMTLKISEFKEQLKSSTTDYSSTGVFKLTIDFFKSEGDDGDSAAKRIEAMKVGDHTSIAFYQLSLIDNINAYTCSSREPFPEKKLRKAVLHAFEGYDYLRNHYVRLLQDDSMSPLAFIREVIVESNKWDQNHIGGKNFMQMVKSHGSAALATVSTNIILPRKRHDELIACEREAIELRTMLARTKDKRNDKRNIEYEEMPRNPLNNRLMCLWHGEGTHDTGMCAYLKKDKKLLKRLEDGEPSTSGTPVELLGGRGPPSSAYNFYYEVRSNVKLLKAINQATTRREKKVLRNHLDSRIRLKIGEGTTTYLSYIGMTKTQGAELRGDLHRNGTSGATKRCLATQGATNAIFGPAIHVQLCDEGRVKSRWTPDELRSYGDILRGATFWVEHSLNDLWDDLGDVPIGVIHKELSQLGNEKQKESFAKIGCALDMVELPPMVRKKQFDGGYFASIYVYSLLACAIDADDFLPRQLDATKVRQLDRALVTAVGYKHPLSRVDDLGVRLREADAIVAEFEARRGRDNATVLKTSLAALGLEMIGRGPWEGYNANYYYNALVSMIQSLDGGSQAVGARGAVLALNEIFVETTSFKPPAPEVALANFADSLRRLDDDARARREAAEQREADARARREIVEAALVSLGLEFCTTGSASEPFANAYDNALVGLLRRIPGGPAARGAAAAVASLNDASRRRRSRRRRVLGDIFAAAARRVDEAPPAPRVVGMGGGARDRAHLQRQCDAKFGAGVRRRRRGWRPLRRLRISDSVETSARQRIQRRGD